MSFVLSEDRALRADFDHIFEANDIHGLLMGKTELILLLDICYGLGIGHFFFTTSFLSA